MKILVILDYIATFIFALVGTYKAIKHELDLFGAFCLALLTGIGGGVLRDILLNQTPLVFSDLTYLVVCMLGFLLAICHPIQIASKWNTVLWLDAFGLALFSYFGFKVAELKEASYFVIVLCGMVTACGGGIIRDICVSEIPSVFKEGFYASVSLIGGICFLFLKIQFNNSPIKNEPFFEALTIVLIMFWIRWVAITFEWNLPKVKKLPQSPTELTKLSKG